MKSDVNLMTRETHVQLQAELVKLQERLERVGKKLGEAFGPNCDWHDNSAADLAVEEFRMIENREADLRKILQVTKIIRPRRDTADVGVGNTIVVRMGDSDVDKKFTLLGPRDSMTGKNRGWISYLSLVGQALLGMKRGETKTLELGEGRAQTIIVKEILPGNFGNGA